jgi:hypothetical protein
MISYQRKDKRGRYEKCIGINSFIGEDFGSAAAQPIMQSKREKTWLIDV